jgi:hypothetical protein
VNPRRGFRNREKGEGGAKSFRTLVSAAVGLLALTLASPAPADDFRLGIGGGPTFVTGNLAEAYKSGWNATVRALWFPSFIPIGVRGAGYYGQDPPKASDVPGAPIGNCALYGVDANAAVRLLGKETDGLYIDLGVGFRSLRQKIQVPNDGTLTRTDSNISYSAGAGFFSRWFFIEFNAVYFRVQGKSLLSIPVTVGFQF